MSNDSPCQGMSSIPLYTDDDDDFIKIDVNNTLFHKAYGSFNEFRMNCQLCDVVLILEGKKLSAHKVILSAVIPYFKSMFASNMLESTMKEIAIESMDYETMEQLLKYAYTGELRISTSNVQALMIGSNFLQLTDVMAESANFLVSRLHSTNCLSIREFCRDMACKTDVLNVIDTFLMKHFLTISKSEEFIKLTINNLLEILSFDGIYVDHEEEVLNCALAWLNHAENRQQYASKVLKCIRLPLLPPAFLSEIVAKNPVIKKDFACRDLIDEAKDYHLIPERRAQMNTFNTNPRVCKNVPGLIVAIGGLMHPSESKSSVEIYDTVTEKWQPFKKMVTLRTRVGVAVYNRQVYALGGFNGHDRLTLAEVFDYDNNVWTTMAPMSRKRSALAAAVVGKNLYVCGGYDGIESLATVEIYDIERKVWGNGANMNRQRSAAGVAVLDGNIYICGGHDGMQIFSSVERLNIDSGIWSPIPQMLSRRCRFGAAELNGKIYVAGGYDGTNFLKSVEVYDPVTNNWNYVSPMYMRRSRVALVATLGKLYAIAGFDGEHNLCSIEIYDPTTDSWELGPQLATHEGGVGVGVILTPPHML